jgi:hypothetical protein
MTILTPTRERFLNAILREIPAEEIAEIHFFQPIKQGGVESGVAVVAADERDASGVGRRASGDERRATGEDDGNILSEAGDLAPDELGDSSLAQDDDSPDARRPTPDARRPTPHAPRHTVYTARYRLVLKGVDRGKWDASVFAEADAPLITVDAVVRGVQRRSGDVDAPDRLMGDEIRALVPAAAATPSTDRP